MSSTIKKYNDQNENTRSRNEKNQNLLFLSSELPDGAEAPELVPLFGYGRTKYTKGGKLDEYEFGPADADRLVAEFVALGVDTPVDYNHQTLRAKENGQPAPAAGWITALEKQPDGLYARVKWTPRAAEMIRNKEYRYTSPTFFRSENGGVARFYNLALTNKPATIDCPELVAQRSCHCDCIFCRASANKRSISPSGNSEKLNIRSSRCKFNMDVRMENSGECFSRYTLRLDASP